MAELERELGGLQLEEEKLRLKLASLREEQKKAEDDLQVAFSLFMLPVSKG